jgi:hypothetical protein
MRASWFVRVGLAGDAGGGEWLQFGPFSKKKARSQARRVERAMRESDRIQDTLELEGPHGDLLIIRPTLVRLVSCQDDDRAAMLDELSDVMSIDTTEFGATEFGEVHPLFPEETQEESQMETHVLHPDGGSQPSHPPRQPLPPKPKPEPEPEPKPEPVKEPEPAKKPARKKADGTSDDDEDRQAFDAELEKMRAEPMTDRAPF